jgi:uncharacterized phiE125 gp8 family phage protein
MAYGFARPILWWRAGQLHVLHRTTGLTPYERWLLRRLGREEPIPFFHDTHGDSMSDDYSSALRLVAPAVFEPVTLAQAKAFLRIEHTGDDAAIGTAISAARLMAERYLRTALLAQTWEYSVGNPCSLTLRLPWGPATSILSVTLVNEQGVSTVLEGTIYRLSVDGRAVLFTSGLHSEIVKVQFIAAAYAGVADIPAPIIQGILHHVATLMEQRDGAAALPMQSVNCYAPFRPVLL